MTMTASRTLSRDDIVAAVADLIVEQGLSALTMRTIAAKLGCSVGTLPHYFKGKDDIVAATLNWSNERIMGRLNAMPPGELSVETLLPVVISSLPLDEQSDREWRIRLCLWDYALTQPVLNQTLREVTAQANEVLERIIGHLQQRRLLTNAIDAGMIATTLFHMTIGMSFNMLHQPLQQRAVMLQPLTHYIDTLRIMPDQPVQ
jgi:AcrR family transcriptional regulator